MTDTIDIEQILTRAWAEANALNGPLNDKNQHYWDIERRLLPELEATYEAFVARTMAAGAAEAAPRIGDEMPEFLLPDSNGHLVTLANILERGPLVLSFNRGHWCPFCRLELNALARAHDPIAASGASIVSVVPETAEFSAAMKAANALPFEVLTDLDCGYSLESGLVVSAGDEIKRLYLGYGLDLSVYQRNSAWFMPTPATFVIGQDGLVKARFVDTDFRRRMAIADILDALARR